MFPGKYGVYEVFGLPPGGSGWTGHTPFPSASVPNGGGCGRTSALRGRQAAVVRLGLHPDTLPRPRARMLRIWRRLAEVGRSSA
eukprot:gene8395-biopygen1594